MGSFGGGVEPEDGGVSSGLVMSTSYAVAMGSSPSIPIHSSNIGFKVPEVPKTKGISKKMKKVLEAERRMQEREFEQAFFREFWPENV